MNAVIRMIPLPSGGGAIFATTRCRVITCLIEQRQLPYLLSPADDTRHCPNNRHRSLPFPAAAAPCPLKAPGRSSCLAKNTPPPDVSGIIRILSPNEVICESFYAICYF
jgi:hypothetical protein